MILRDPTLLVRTPELVAIAGANVLAGVANLTSVLRPGVLDWNPGLACLGLNPTLETSERPSVDYPPRIFLCGDCGGEKPWADGVYEKDGYLYFDDPNGGE